MSVFLDLFFFGLQFSQQEPVAYVEEWCPKLKAINWIQKVQLYNSENTTYIYIYIIYIYYLYVQYLSGITRIYILIPWIIPQLDLEYRIQEEKQRKYENKKNSYSVVVLADFHNKCLKAMPLSSLCIFSYKCITPNMCSALGNTNSNNALIRPCIDYMRDQSNYNQVITFM